MYSCLLCIMASEGASLHFSLFVFFVFLHSGQTGPVSMGAKGELCEEYRFWHGELACCKDITISEISAIFSCLNVCKCAGEPI